MKYYVFRVLKKMISYHVLTSVKCAYISEHLNYLSTIEVIKYNTVKKIE